ncbi:glycogen debranching enzyme isoform X2 [Atheta coriaria]
MGGQMQDVRKDKGPVRVLNLSLGQHQDSVIYRIKRNTSLQFRLGPNLFGKRGKLFFNYPVGIRLFKRDEYQDLEWRLDDNCKNSDDTAYYAKLKLTLPGGYHYYLEDRSDKSILASGYVLVDPELSFGPNEPLPLDCIQCQTVLAKSLGHFNTWPGKLLVAKEAGYNMIHFTPIQELGDSNSSYSLRDQLKLNPQFNDKHHVTKEELSDFIEKLRSEWKMLSICDIVLNHTANESPWLVDHPEATYNCLNCPYLRPAYLLDAALYQFSRDVRDGVYETSGIPKEISTEDHLNAVRHCLQTEVLRRLRLQELIICDVTKLVSEFLVLVRTRSPYPAGNGENLPGIQIITDRKYKRMKSTVNMELALKHYNVYRSDCFDEETRIQKCTEEFKNTLDELNRILEDNLQNDLNAAVENTIAGIRYYRVQPDGMQWKEISEDKPLIYRYFTDYGKPETYAEHESIMYSPNAKYLMAHNGWVMNSDPLTNFASNANVYLRRELIAWGDSVKLRYGERPEDCPFLWKHMQTYVEETARVFDGVRLDNCHSTPLVVAEYLLDCARIIKPNLYVVAELFTNSDLTDNVFVNRLGITSLIREAASAWDSHEEGRLVYRYGGSPVGAFYEPSIRPLTPTIAHALFMDLTHDNPSPVEKRSAYDLLPTTALVNMACCASGSTRGYDELVPHHIHVVEETREYTEWGSDPTNVRYVNFTNGILHAKKIINKLHHTLGFEGYEQVYVDQMDADIVAVTRHNPITHSSVILVAFTSFSTPKESDIKSQRSVKPLRVEGTLDEVIFEASIADKDEYSYIHDFQKDNRYINGLRNMQVIVKEHFPLEKSEVLVEQPSGDCNMLQFGFKNFHPGSVVAIRVSLKKSAQSSVKILRNLIESPQVELKSIINDLSLNDLNRALYRCSQEEYDDGFNIGCYNVPGHGELVYAGLQGVMSLLATIRPNNDLGHPLCDNLRKGDWLLEYIHRRLQLHKTTKLLGDWIEDNTQELKKIPRYLIPAYFDAIITKIYVELIEASAQKMGDFVKHGSVFVRALALGSVQFGAFVKSARLPTLSPKLKDPPPNIVIIGDEIEITSSLSAGLPHFATGYMRNWGRDTFIALRGLYILTGRYQDARYMILAYAACLRHGLIPNLLDGGKNSRFNCRDAVWWWLYSIKSYVEEVPGGESIFQDPVSRIFPKDDSEAHSPGTCDQPLHRVMHEALEVHFQGMTFRERNAGSKIDEHMVDQGFNNQIGIHPETGFVFGGNEHNCGTWMDKMGSSQKAGIKGKVATPRDGSAVELIGLCKGVITWLTKMHDDHYYPHNSVQRKQKNGTFVRWTFKEWAEKIQVNFEKLFWIDEADSEVENKLIHKKNVYKDCYGASRPWTDYQLRCNFPVAMVTAPELFNPTKAWKALEQAEKYLLGPLGMKTLDSEDWNYRGDYDNSNDSEDKTIAHGFNYHQGPEWLWPTGYYLRAKLIFGAKVNKLPEAITHVKAVLANHFVDLQSSEWRGLPELTNADGAYCRDSCRTQAWSMSSILEVLHDLQRIEMSN